MVLHAGGSVPVSWFLSMRLRVVSAAQPCKGLVVAGEQKMWRPRVILAAARSVFAGARVIDTRAQCMHARAGWQHHVRMHRSMGNRRTGLSFLSWCSTPAAASR